MLSLTENRTSVPSIVDGLTLAQRKVLYTCFRRNLIKDTKVEDLARSVAELTACSLGEFSIPRTIIALAQDFVGTNNINYLEPNGNFGSRLAGGRDAADPRFIYTRLSPSAHLIFSQQDEPLLTHEIKHGKQNQPELYVPTVPMILINGADDTATDESTIIPKYNPIDVIENLKRRMYGQKEDMIPMKPWFRGWTGEIENIGGEHYKLSGNITRTSDCEVVITELPVRLWTHNFKAELDDIMASKKELPSIVSYTEQNTGSNVCFKIKVRSSETKSHESGEKSLQDGFMLSRTTMITNLAAVDTSGHVRTYDSPLDILEEFFQVRLEFYQRRKRHMLAQMRKPLERAVNQAKFITMVTRGELVIWNKERSVLVAELDRNFARMPGEPSGKKQKKKETATGQDLRDFEYLLDMKFGSLTEECVTDMNRAIGKMEKEVEVLNKTTPKRLWEIDLDNLAEQLRKETEAMK